MTPDLDPLFFPLMEFHRLAITSRWRRLAAAYNAITYQTRTVVKAKEFDALTARMTNPLWWCHGTPHAVKLEALLMYPTEELGWHSGCHAAHIAAKVGAQGVVLNSKREYMWKGEDGEMVTPLITERKADGSFPKNALLAKPPFTGAELDAALRAFAEGVNANGMYLLIERQQGHNKPPVEWIDVDEEPMVGEFYL